MSSRFEGTWENLRLGALVRADKADLRYQDWLRKPAEVPATIRTQMSREKQGLVFHPSELDLGANKLDFSGSIDLQAAPWLRVKLRSQGGSIPAWGRFLTTPTFQAIAGKVDLDVTVAKSWSVADSHWSVVGALRLNNAALTHRVSGRSVEDLQAEVSFDGSEGLGEKTLDFVWAGRLFFLTARALICSNRASFPAFVRPTWSWQICRGSARTRRFG